MRYLVDKVVLDTGDKVIITMSNGNKVKAVYRDTVGYAHNFDCGDGKEINLSNHFMRLKGISVEKDTSPA